MAPFQDMMLQSWDGAINIFPRWPKPKDARFRNWRAQGTFIVSAVQKGGRIVEAEILSEKGVFNGPVPTKSKIKHSINLVFVVF